MIAHLGVDVQSVSDIEKALGLFGARYLEGVYDDDECNFARSHPQTAAPYLAGRFAAREAILKLLEAPDAMAIWNDIRLGGDGASPTVKLGGKALHMADVLGISTIFLSIAQRRFAATAIAVADRTSFQ